jgi:hypothetical protein
LRRTRTFRRKDLRRRSRRRKIRRERRRRRPARTGRTLRRRLTSLKRMFSLSYAYTGWDCHLIDLCVCLETSIWNEHRNGTVDAPKTDADLASWEAEFSQFANGSVASAFEEMEADQARRHLEELGGLEDDEAFRNDVLGTEDEQGFPRLGRYTFGEMPSSTRDWLA